MTFKPLGDKVLIKNIPVEKAGFIDIPETANIPKRGKVISCGDGYVTSEGCVPLSVKAGDKVMYQAGAGLEISLDGEDYLLMQEVNILGVVE